MPARGVLAASVGFLAIAVAAWAYVLALARRDPIEKMRSMERIVAAAAIEARWSMIAVSAFVTALFLGLVYFVMDG